MIKEEEVFRIGRIGKAHGVHGEVSFQVDDDVFDRTDADFLVLDIDAILVPFYIESYRFKSQNVALMKFCNVKTQDQARELTGCDVYFLRRLADEDNINMGHAQLVGYRLVDSSNGCEVGKIRAIDDTTVNLLFEVERKDGVTVLIPASEELIEDIDNQRQLVKTQLPQGILDLD